MTRLALLVALGVAVEGSPQWTNRYPKVEGYAHHVYLEGYELPVLNPGPSDPAPSPDGRTVAISARGWLWLLDLDSGRAARLTRGSQTDFRPRWSPNGERIAFVRDDTSDTALVELDVASGEERILVNEATLELDAAYSRDGTSLFYASASAGDLDLWRLDLGSGARTRLTRDAGLELSPLPASDDSILFVTKARGGKDTLSLLDLRTGEARVRIEEAIASQMRPAIHPDGKSLVVPLPGPDRWGLWLMDLAGGPAILLTAANGRPLTPAFGPDGTNVYFVEADSEQRFQLMVIPAVGGEARPVGPIVWDWGEPTEQIEIRTRLAGRDPLVPARLHITDSEGHPALPDSGQPRFDSQSGKIYVYSPGTLTVEVPKGGIRVEAARGLSAPVASATTNGPSVELEMTPLWDAEESGWYSGDHHFHLNYGGPYRLDPSVLETILDAEELDVATPLMANLHTRLNDVEFLSWRRANPGRPFLSFGQEVRPHFLGHMGLIGIETPHWPWYWGPGYPVRADDDRPNESALQHSRREGGVNAFVHPVSDPAPFPNDGPPRAIPLALVPEAMAGNVDTLELACLWSDEIGTVETWYRLLNVGVPIAPSAGTDAFSDFYRAMALGTTRVYVKVDGPVNLRSYLDALRNGRSFVTTAPFLNFIAGGAGPGDVLQAAVGSDVPWEITIASAIPVEKVEVLVNGRVVWTAEGLTAPGRKTYSGRTTAPAGGWIAARAVGGRTVWPAMDSYPFAQTGAAWFGRIGSIDPGAARTAARELLAWMDVAEERLSEGYGRAEIPRLQESFARARRRLEALSSPQP
jgi:TolB protein